VIKPLDKLSEFNANEFPTRAFGSRGVSQAGLEVRKPAEDTELMDKMSRNASFRNKQMIGGRRPGLTSFSSPRRSMPGSRQDARRGKDARPYVYNKDDELGLHAMRATRKPVTPFQAACAKDLDGNDLASKGPSPTNRPLSEYHKRKDK
jgi:hypothetical protein